MPARRRRRRTRRRDVERGVGEYDPLTYHRSTARRGVRARLGAAVLSMGFTIACLLVILLGSQTQYGVAAMAAFAFCSFNAGVAFLMGARREESVHALATELDGRPLLEAEPSMEPDGSDGSV